MVNSQDGAPLAVRLALGVLIAGLALLTAHNWLHLTTTRPYRAAMNEGFAIAELRRCAGQQFDPRVVTAFERVIAAKRVSAPERLAA